MNENETKPPRTRRIAAVRRHEAAHPDWTPQDQREHFWNTAMQVFGVSTWTEVDERDANDKRWDEIFPDNADAISADGIYHTPPEVLVDAVLGNPPLGGITDTPDEAKPTVGGKSMHEPSRSRHAANEPHEKALHDRGGHWRAENGNHGNRETPCVQPAELGKAARRASGKGGVI